MIYYNKTLIAAILFLLVFRFSASSQSGIEEIAILFEGEVSTPMNERDFTMSPNGEEIYFTRSHFNNQIRAILTSKIKNGRYGKPEVASFSGKFNDLEPFFSPNGNRIYFASNRNKEQTAEKKDFDIWYVERDDDGNWSKAKRLSEVINTDKDEFYPAITNSGNLYFTASRANGLGTEDIFISEFKNGIYQEVQPLSEQINSKTYEFNAYVNPEETLIIFSSYGREDGMGGGDLYYSTKDKNGNWQEANNLGEKINTNSLDYCPYYDEKESTLFFTSNIGNEKQTPITAEQLDKSTLGTLNGYGNIYQVQITFH